VCTSTRVPKGRGAIKAQLKCKGVEDGPSSKCQKKGVLAEEMPASPATVSSPASLSSHLPDDTPSWVPLALKFLDSKVSSNVAGEEWMDIGPKWSGAISTWISIEIDASFVATKLGTLK
jgi:hypothetical protein